MLKFANAKINIGLHVVAKRNDGYHEIQTIFYPVKLYDTLEIIHSEKLQLNIHDSTLSSDEDNLCLRAYRLLANDFDIPPFAIHLLKKIPMGAGLGGGSSDASSVLQLINNECKLNLSESQLESYAAKLGADCSFFIKNLPAYAEGIGDKLSSIQLDLSSYYIVILKPHDVHISTKKAYSMLTVRPAKIDLREALKLPIQQWKEFIQNDFEEGVFKIHPEIQAIKHALYSKGAIYASMTGSGSAVFGIFQSTIDLSELSPLAEVYYPVEI